MCDDSRGSYTVMCHGIFTRYERIFMHYIETRIVVVVRLCGYEKIRVEGGPRPNIYN